MKLAGMERRVSCQYQTLTLSRTPKYSTGSDTCNQQAIHNKVPYSHFNAFYLEASS